MAENQPSISDMFAGLWRFGPTTDGELERRLDFAIRDLEEDNIETKRTTVFFEKMLRDTVASLRDVVDMNSEIAAHVPKNEEYARRHHAAQRMLRTVDELLACCDKADEMSATQSRHRRKNG